MNKKIFHVLIVLPLLAIAVIAFKPVSSEAIKAEAVTKAPNACSPHGSADITQCCNFISPNSTFLVSGDLVNFQVFICYVPSATPPWTTNNQIGIITDPAKRPTGTRVITATTGSTATWQVTIYSSGAMYAQFISGTTPGQGTNIRGTYALTNI